MTDIEPLVAAGAFNENGGLQYSRVIEKKLVDVFVPFLPLERKHVKICVRNEMNKRGIEATEDMIDNVADQLEYWPPQIKLFSTSGCKRIAQKVDLLIEELEENSYSKQEL